MASTGPDRQCFLSLGPRVKTTRTSVVDILNRMCLRGDNSIGCPRCGEWGSFHVMAQPNPTLPITAPVTFKIINNAIVWHARFFIYDKELLKIFPISSLALVPHHLELSWAYQSIMFCVRPSFYPCIDTSLWYPYYTIHPPLWILS